MERIKISPEYLQVVRCNKVCRSCGTRWKGLYFRGWVKRAAKEWVANVPLKAKAYVKSWCDDCIDVWERNRERHDLEGSVRALDDLLKVAPSKGRRILLMRRKADVLSRIRDTYDPMSKPWQSMTDRIRGLQEAIREMQDAK